MDSKFYKEIGRAVENATRNGGDLTTQNLLYVVKLAVNIAKKTGADENELIAVGTEAMKKVEKKYDSTKNDNFVKACGTAVRGEMMNFINRSNLVHIPVNHQSGFKKGVAAKKETSEITYHDIDSYNYDSDTLGECYSNVFPDEESEVMRRGLKTLDECGRKSIKIKFRLDEYENLKYNNFKVMADELNTTVQNAKQVYTEAFEKLAEYCQKEMNGEKAS
jgi:hypothetical protein